MYDLDFTITELNSDPYMQKCVCLLAATDANTGLRYNGGLLIYIDLSMATDCNEVMVNSGTQQWQGRSISIAQLRALPSFFSCMWLALVLASTSALEEDRHLACSDETSKATRGGAS